mmetsp:Transcript_49513/g.117863  ORF Transcript_49513/g.117863 Transcript_49513/m.117863 type:complete len:157 (-) Transcript_49513:530-1000(-)
MPDVWELLATGCVTTGEETLRAASTVVPAAAGGGAVLGTEAGERVCRGAPRTDEGAARGAPAVAGPELVLVPVAAAALLRWGAAAQDCCGRARCCDETLLFCLVASLEVGLETAGLVLMTQSTREPWAGLFSTAESSSAADLLTTSGALRLEADRS